MTDADEHDALTRYQRLRDEAAKLRAHRNRFGRTDVPYDHDQHLSHAGDEVQRKWHEANRQMEELEKQRDDALEEYLAIRGFR